MSWCSDNSGLLGALWSWIAPISTLQRAKSSLCVLPGGGAGMPLVPVTAGQPIDEWWQRTLLQSNIDGIAKTTLLPEGEASRYSDIGGGDYRQLLLRVLVDLDGPTPVVQTCRGMPHDDPWYLSYLAVLGDLLQGPDSMNSWNDLAAGLTYDDVVDVRDIQESGSAAGMVGLMRTAGSISAVDLTRAKLSVGISAATNRGLFAETSRFEWDDDRLSRRYGPNCIVVYRPGRSMTSPSYGTCAPASPTPTVCPWPSLTPRQSTAI
jgi:hypothetical protein